MWYVREILELDLDLNLLSGAEVVSNRGQNHRVKNLFVRVLHFVVSLITT